VAVSGAALNPNMGYNSNPALAFLMTFFQRAAGLVDHQSAHEASVACEA